MVKNCSQFVGMTILVRCDDELVAFSALRIAQRKEKRSIDDGLLYIPVPWSSLAYCTRYIRCTSISSEPLPGQHPSISQVGIRGGARRKYAHGA